MTTDDDFQRLLERKRSTLPPSRPKSTDPLADLPGIAALIARDRIESEPENAAERARAQEEARAAATKEARERRWGVLSKQIGSRYAGCRLENYKCDPKNKRQVKALEQTTAYRRDMKARLEAGNGWVAYGNPGTGKDHLMVSLMHSMCSRCDLELMWVNGVALYAANRDRISSDRSELEFAERYIRPKVLAISDPLPPITENDQSKGALTQGQATLVLWVIDQRYRDNKPTWLTMNATDRDELQRRMGFALVSRMLEQAEVVECFWADYRERA